MLKQTIIDLYETANSRKWKPWELQSRLKDIYSNVIAVGDDLSFTIKLEEELKDVNLGEIGAQKCKIHPFKNAYRFDRGFVAFEGRFLRVSAELDKKLLLKVLELILPED